MLLLLLVVSLNEEEYWEEVETLEAVEAKLQLVVVRDLGKKTLQREDLAPLRRLALLASSFSSPPLSTLVVPPAAPEAVLPPPPVDDRRPRNRFILIKI